MKRLHATRPAAPARRHAALAATCCVALVAAATGWPMSALAAANGSAASGAGGGGFAEFDRSLLSGDARRAADLARFEHGNPVLPGTYNLDVYRNKDWVGRLDVRFAAAQPGASAVPCVDHDLLNRLGLVPPPAAAPMPSPTSCVQLGDVIPGATFTVDLADLRLDASVPQMYLNQMPRGYVDPASWDAGVPAFLLNYNFNTYHTRNQGQSQTSSYLGLNAGLNLGLWHFRQDSTVTWQSAVAGQAAQRNWHNIDAYVRRDLPKLRASLTLGDSYTDGAVFDSYGLRGVQLGSDDRMLPQSLRGYAPVVRGVADTNARITVRQNGVQIYQTTVAPGPFVIDDLYPTGYGGDLVVTVTEADGREHSFRVPYDSLAQLLRTGVTRFDIAAGQLRDNALQDKPDVVQATAQRGFSNLFTGYAGVQGSEGYAAVLVGGAFNTRYGALSLDLTEAHARIPGFASHSGQSLRISYSKILPETDTSLTVAAYRYSTGGFLSLQDAALARDYARRGLDTFRYLPGNIPTIDGVPALSLLTPAQRAALAGNAYSGDPLVARGLLHQRNRFTLTLSQRLGQTGGSLYATAAASDYWNRSGSDTQFQLGYSHHFRRLDYNLSASRSRLPFGGYDNQFFVNLNLPLGRSVHAPSFSLNLNHSTSGGTQEQALVNGTAGAWNQFTWGASASRTGDGAGSAASANAGYYSPYAVFNASVGKGSGYSQESFNVGGAVVAHRGGVTFGQPIGDTVAIVHVPDAGGAHITNAPGVRVDRFGYALVPYLTPYQLDTIQIDPQGLPLGVQLDATSAQVVPYAGAVVMVDFKTRYGRALIVRIRRSNGAPLPFGTEVLDAAGQSVGTVGQGGLALLRVASKAGQLNAQWQGPQGIARACSFAYAVPAPAPSAPGQPRLDATCAGGVEAASQQQGGP